MTVRPPADAPLHAARVSKSAGGAALSGAGSQKKRGLHVTGCANGGPPVIVASMRRSL